MNVRPLHDRVLIKRIETPSLGVPRPRVTRSVARGYDDEWILSEDRVRELSSRDAGVR